MKTLKISSMMDKTDNSNKILEAMAGEDFEQGDLFDLNHRAGEIYMTSADIPFDGNDWSPDAESINPESDFPKGTILKIIAYEVNNFDGKEDFGIEVTTPDGDVDEIDMYVDNVTSLIESGAIVKI